MPSPFTSSFASAAAGTNNSDSGFNGRNTGSGDWSRARTNGTTNTTFRRPSAATGSSYSRDGPQTSNNPPPSAGSVYVPPHMNSNYQSAYSKSGSSTESRYSKDQLLDFYNLHEKSGFGILNLEDLFVDGWRPAVNGLSNGGWGKRDDHKENNGPELCWDHSGSVQPLALAEMTEEEKETFASSVNSPLKPPTQNANKDGTPNNSVLSRRTSVTQNTNNSPSTRPGAKRRESGGDLLQNALTSPVSNRFSLDGSSVSSPPPSLMRRKTDIKENFGSNLDERDGGNSRTVNDAPSPFGTLKRTSTQPASAGLSGSTFPWSGAPQSAGFSPMGAFGNFALSGAGQTPTSSEKKTGFGSLRGESRFKGLMGASSSEDLGSKVKEKPSLNNLARLPESASEQQQSHWSTDRSSQPRGLSTDFYADENHVPGISSSATLGGADDSLPFQQTANYRNPDRHSSYDDIGFSSLSMNDDMPGFREMAQHREFSQQQTPQAKNQGLAQTNESMSPTTTNPYQSPEGRSGTEEIDIDDPERHHVQYQSGAQYGNSSRGFHAQLDDPKGDRSQTSSTGAGRAYPPLGNLGNLTGQAGSPWSAAPGAIGTQSRVQPSQATAFGDSGFGALNDLTSLHSGLGGGGLFGGASVGLGGSRTKLSSLLPNAIQGQTRGETTRQEHGSNDNLDAFQRNSGHDASGFGLRESENSSRLGRGSMEDLFVSPEARVRSLQNHPSTFAGNDIASSQPQLSAALQTPFSAGTSSGGYFTKSQEQDASSSQMPASQQRTMVMPDRMRWIYRDPQGNTQGPWSGLEMHDWYKAGFFSPELQVKKLEDGDYEPLAQLIRRIGNSREPFLVPQIGIAHGSSNPLPNSSAAPVGTIPAATPSTAQPPFANSFPSFGTTLSADQQNALERRKQEEQYLMARQKEHLAQQQLAMKQMQHMQQGGQLHHHSSAHSLQSQPSFGSITSPMGYQPTSSQGLMQPPGPAPGSGFFDGLSRGTGPLGADILGSVREEDMPGFTERFSTMGRAGLLSYAQDNQAHQQHAAEIMQERIRQQREQEQYDSLRHGTEDQRLTAERLEQYHQLRSQEEQQQQYQRSSPVGGYVDHQMSETDIQTQQHQEQADFQTRSQMLHEGRKPSEPPSLSEQVQKAAAKQISASQPQSPWAKVDTGMPQPFPPPQSQSPMPAPTPQRNRQSVADALNAESQSPSRTESTDTPSAAIAPWAKEPTEGSKGPSLKDIQAMEAKKAAQKEEVAVAARRALAEQERQAQQNQHVAPAPGLPSSANWATTISPAVPATTVTSAWAKPSSNKAAIATPVTGAKKTLAQIQKEEEARKNRAAAVAANVANNPAASIAGGKRYADLASKAAAPSPALNSAWTTVGASGKVKSPTTPAPGLNIGTASGGIIQPQATTTKSKSAATTNTKGPENQQHAKEDFHRWTKGALSKGLNSNISVDNFVTELLLLPPDAEIISDSIYASSQTLDGRRFAEEFVRRRKLADRGVIPDSSSSTGFSSPSNGNESKGSGGWSEVAKKGPPAPKEEPNAAYKVVGGKKKASKR